MLRMALLAVAIAGCSSSNGGTDRTEIARLEARIAVLETQARSTAAPAPRERFWYCNYPGVPRNAPFWPFTTCFRDRKQCLDGMGCMVTTVAFCEVDGNTHSCYATAEQCEGTEPPRRRCQRQEP